MIGKGNAIANTGTNINYGWNQEKDAEVVFSQHLAGENAQQITGEFKLIQEQNTRCQKNTLSFILSPTREDGKNLTKEQLGELTQKFIKEMRLKENQAVAFVHRDKAHTHVHLYVNRIGFDGKAYNDSFIGKRSQLAAENVAKEMGLTTVKEVQLEKELDSIHVRLEIKNIHQRVMESQRPKTLDDYMKAMKAQSRSHSEHQQGEQVTRFSVSIPRSKFQSKRSAPCHVRRKDYGTAFTEQRCWEIHGSRQISPVIGEDFGNEYQSCHQYGEKCS